MAREQALQADAHEVRYAERRFQPRHPASLDEIRAGVDALQIQRRPLPEPQMPAPLPPPPAPEPAPAAMDPRLEAALAPLVPGKLVRVEVVEQIAGGEIVEAAYENGSGTRSALYVLRGDEAKPFDDIAARIDALPVPAVAAPAAEAPPAPEAAPEAAPAKKGRFGLGKKKADAPAPEAREEAQPEKAKKGMFGRRAKEEVEAPAPQAEPAPDSSPDEKAGKKRFGFRRK